ncbi:hypothetical protein J6590_075326 [Homalodisca vitripennis]|nr:hypothetical protein J6590_075326 [Homalodisca vitripennis]
MAERRLTLLGFHVLYLGYILDNEFHLEREGEEALREKSIFWCGLQSKSHLLRLKTADGSVIPKPLLTAKSTVASHYRNWRELVDATAQTNLPQLPPDRATLGRTVRLNPLVPCSRCLPATTPSETKIQP